MGFDKFGVISHTPETNVADFVNYLGQGKVMATRCKKCGATYFPPRVDCASCFSSDPEWFEVKGEGKLLNPAQFNNIESAQAKEKIILFVGRFSQLKQSKNQELLI